MSVKPAASETSFGRSSLIRINHEIGGADVRRPSSERALFVFVLIRFLFDQLSDIGSMSMTSRRASGIWNVSRNADNLRLNCGMREVRSMIW